MSRSDASFSELIEEIGRIDPSITARFAPPASEAEIERLEAFVGLPLPEEAKAVYRLHDGQGASAGVWTIYHRYLMTIQEAMDTMTMYREFWEESVARPRDPWVDELGDQDPPDDPRLGLGIYSPWRVPVLHDDTGNYVGYDLEPGPAGTYGQVLVYGADVDPQVVCDSLGELWGALLHELRTGNWVLQENPHYGNRWLDFKRQDSPVARLLSL